jgi:hypothetical protein
MKSTCLFSILLLIFLTSTGSTSAAILYGTEKSTGCIYEIDTKDESATPLIDLHEAEIVPSSAPEIRIAGDSPNGNAYDNWNDRFYFASFQDPGCPADPDVVPSNLYFIDLSNPTVVHWAGELKGHASDGAFYFGQYWYIRHGTNKLAVVNLNSDGYIINEYVAEKILFYDRGVGVYEPYLAFGDIEFNNAGLCYLTGRDTNSKVGTYYISGILNIRNGRFIEIGNHVYWGQLAFGPYNMILYSHDAGSGDFSVINPINGKTRYCFTGYQLTDLASSDRTHPVCKHKAWKQPWWKQKYDDRRGHYDYHHR